MFDIGSRVDSKRILYIFVTSSTYAIFVDVVSLQNEIFYFFRCFPWPDRFSQKMIV